MIFIGAIITLVLLGTIADSVFDQTSTREAVNETFTLPTAVNTTVELTGRTLVTARPNIENVTGDDVTQWFIVDSRLGTGGLLTIAITSNGTSDLGTNLGIGANTSYVYEPEGHAVNATDSSVIQLIILFAALAVTLFVILGFMNNGSLARILGKEK